MLWYQMPDLIWKTSGITWELVDSIYFLACTESHINGVSVNNRMRGEKNLPAIYMTVQFLQNTLLVYKNGISFQITFAKIS